MEDHPAEFPATRARRPAQSIVELALILPIFMLLLLGVVDLGRAFFESIAIQGAAEAGSMKAIDYTRNKDDATRATGNAAVSGAIKASTNPDLFPYLQIQDADIDVSDIQWQPNTAYTITVKRNFQLLTPFLGNVFGSQALTLRAVARGWQNCLSAC